MYLLCSHLLSVSTVWFQHIIEIIQFLSFWDWPCKDSNFSISLLTFVIGLLFVCFDLIAAILMVWEVGADICCERVLRWERLACVFMLIQWPTGEWLWGERQQESTVAITGEKMAASSRVWGSEEIWEWSCGKDRKKRAVGRKIYVWKSHWWTQDPVCRRKFLINSLTQNFLNSWADCWLESKLCIHQCLVINEGTCFLGRAQCV